MKLTDALKRIQTGVDRDHPYRLLLACGFSPLHLQTYTHAFFQQRLTGRKVEVETGLFGDIPGTLHRAVQSLQEPEGPKPHAVAVVLEWADLDARLGYRSLGGWGPRQEPDIVNEVRRSLDALRPLLSGLAAQIPVVLCLPTLRLPPAFHTTSWQYSTSAAAIETDVLAFARDMAAGSCLVVNRDRLAVESRLEGRLDLKSELYHGFPYTLEHASHVGEALAQLLAPTTPLKGLITDLDDTFWGGIVGETGAEAVAWDLTSHQQLHGLYQQTLHALADQGVLIAVASKNDSEVASRALGREDAVLPASKIFPLEVHWQAKSASVTRILEAWNIAAESVVFVDDSPLELAEVKATRPAVECVAFPKDGYAKAEAFLRGLRDRFGKPSLSPEDELRRESLRQAAAWKENIRKKSIHEGAPLDAFLATLDASIRIHTRAVADARALELVNKTNQFNLNGRRYDAGAWSEAAEREGAFVWAISYQDKFGPLGKIAVVAGDRVGSRVSVGTWVMSCRAFARRIEYQTLRQIFEHLQVDEIDLDYIPTGRNGPSAELLQTITGRAAPEGKVTLTRQAYEAACPDLKHQVTHGE